MEALWPFDYPKNVAVITTRHVAIERKPILRVFHDEDDGMWQFLSSEEVKIEDAMILSLEKVYALDNTISEIADLPLGWVAWRQSIVDLWKRKVVE